MRSPWKPKPIGCQASNADNPKKRCGAPVSWTRKTYNWHGGYPSKERDLFLCDAHKKWIRSNGDT